ncbi:MAG TPA: hypothetical protein VGH79_07020 [Gaiellaceae bacterium]
MRRPLLVASVAASATCVVLSACGSSLRGISSPPLILKPVPPSPTALRFSTASNRAFARRDAEKLIRIAVVPPTARRVAAVPDSAPAWFRSEWSHHGFPGAAIVRRAWVIHEPLRDVVRFVRTHVPPRPRPEAPFRRPLSTHRIGSRPTDDYLFPPIPGRSSSRWANVTMLALPHGGTVISAQAGDTWIKPPPRSAEIPRTVRRIDITSRYYQRRPSVRVHVRDRYDVGSIVSWMNGLGVSPNYICFDGYFGRPTVTLTFRNAAGNVLARASEGGSAGGPCGSLSLTVKGRKVRPLLVGDLLRMIDQHLNVDLAPPLPSTVAMCLDGDGWHVRRVAHGLLARKKAQSTTITFHSTGNVTTTGPPHPAITRCLRSRPSFVNYG